MDSTTLHFQTIATLAPQLRSGALSPVDLVEAVLGRIESQNPRLKALITVTAERARAEAEQAEREIAGGRYRGPLHGIPFSAKDIIDTASVRTTGGSRLFEGYVPPSSATVIERLETAGAILVGKNNLHEFAMGGTQEFTFGAPVNPWSETLTTGASSNGSGVAVASGMSVFSLGTDTGGSVRSPAAAAGLYGFKPSFGRISRDGVWPLEWSLDCVGVLARSPADCRQVAEAMSGPDERDPTTQAPEIAAAPSLDAVRRLDGMRIGLLSEYCDLEGESESTAAARNFVAFLERCGATVDRISVPEVAHAGALFLIVRGTDHTLLHSDLDRTLELVDENVRLSLLISALLPAATVSKTRRLLAHLRSLLRGAFASVDAMVWLGATAITARLAEARRPDPETPDAVIERFFPTRGPTVIANIAGTPAMAIPTGFSDDGAPLSVQVGAPLYHDSAVLSVAEAWAAEIGPLPVPPVPEPDR